MPRKRVRNNFFNSHFPATHFAESLRYAGFGLAIRLFLLCFISRLRGCSHVPLYLLHYGFSGISGLGH